MLLRRASALIAVLIAVAGPASRATAQDTSACITAARPAWTAVESWVWGRICAGETADLGKSFPGPTTARRLSGAFLSALLFDPQLKALVPHGGIHIAAGEVSEPLKLGDAALGYELALQHMHFLADVDLHGLATADSFSLAGSRFDGSLNLDGSTFGANLGLTGVAVAGQLRMIRASIGGSGELEWINIGEGLNMERLSVAHNLELRGAALPGIDLLGASIKADISMQDTSVSGWAWLEDLQVGSDLFMDRARLQRTDLPDANIGGNLKLTGATLGGPLNLQGIKIGQDLLLDKGRFPGIAMGDGDVGYNLRLDGSLVEGPLFMPAAHIGHVLSLGRLGRFEGPVDLDFIRVDDSLLLTGSQFAESVALNGAIIGQAVVITDGARLTKPLRMTFAKIGTNLDFTGGSFDSVDLTGTTIGAEIRLASKGYAAIAWDPAAQLVLRNVSAKALQDLPEAWPTTVDLQGFTYERLGGYRESESNDVAARDAQSFIDWLAKQRQYAPQPYHALSDVLRAAGYPDKAKQVLYAGYMREWREAKGVAWFWQAMRWAIIGFGLYPQRSALWILVLVPLGAFIFSFEPQVRLRAMRPVDRLIYSLDALLPFVTLRTEHNSYDLQSWPKYYLYFHKIMGYVLIAFLLSALTGA